MLTTRLGTCKVCVNCGRCQQGTKGLSALTASFHTRELPADEKKKVQTGFIIVDIGTTTIAMELYDFQGGKCAQYVCANPQRIFGSDVLSRISAAENKMNALQMQRQLKEVLCQGISYFESEHEPVEEIYVSGNTTMLYFLLGKDVSPLGVAPFVTDALSMETFMLEGKNVYTLPGISAFVGSDVLSGMLALGMDRKEKLSLFIDLGTNGEMILGNRDKLICTSVAAGPAFDMAVSEHDIAWGADIIRLVSVLIHRGIVDETGLLCEEYFEEGVTIGGIKITQDYLHKLLLAKAAVAAGISVLAKEYGLTDLGEITRVYVAGGMGFSMDEEAAIRIGMFPKQFRGKTVTVGNTSLAGAYYFARCQTAISQADIVKSKIEYINLAQNNAFTEEYCAKMLFNGKFTKICQI